MTTVPVVLHDGIDFLDITGRMRRGRGDIFISGPVSPEVEDEIQKAIRFAAELSDLGEFVFPDLSCVDIHLAFTCRLSQLPVVGTSYGLGLGVEILRLFSARSFPVDCCYTGELTDDGSTAPVGMLPSKRAAAAREGFGRIFLPAEQLDFFCSVIDQSPVESIYQAWTVLTYGG
jgi:predicted S18 family serine protease